VARALGVSLSWVCHYLAGRVKGASVEEYLLSIGCPGELLGLPAGDEEEAA